MREVRPKFTNCGASARSGDRIRAMSCTCTVSSPPELKIAVCRSSLCTLQRHSPPPAASPVAVHRSTAPPSGAKVTLARCHWKVVRSSPDVFIRLCAASAAPQADHKMARISARAPGEWRVRDCDGARRIAVRLCQAPPDPARSSGLRSRSLLERSRRVARPRTGEAVARKPAVVAASREQGRSSTLRSQQGR